MIPNLKENFRSDLSKNIRRMTNDFTKDIYIADIEKEAIMYSCSMCLELKKQSGFLPPPMITEITNQVCEVMSSMFDVYTEMHGMMCQLSVQQNMDIPNIQSIVDNYHTSH